MLMNFIKHIRTTQPLDVVQEAVQFFEPLNIIIVKKDEEKGDTWRYLYRYRDDLPLCRLLNRVPRSFWSKYIGYPLGHISAVDFPNFAYKFESSCRVGEDAIYGNPGNKCVLIASLSPDAFADFLEFELLHYVPKTREISKIKYGYELIP